MSNIPAAQRRPHDDLLLSMAIVQSIADGIVVGDRTGRVCMISPAAAQLLDIDSDAFLGANLTDLPGVDATDITSGNGSRPIMVNGRSLHVHWVAVRSNGDGNDWIGNVVVYHDTSRDSNARQERFSAMLHELRTCLAAMRASIDMLFLDSIGTLSDKQRELLNIARNGNAGALNLLNRLREISRPTEPQSGRNDGETNARERG